MEEQRTWTESCVLWIGILLLLGIYVWLTLVLEDLTGIEWAQIYRATCALVCIGFMVWISRDHPGERWPIVSIAIASIVNIGLFFTPLTDGEPSRGDFLIFALPDAFIMLAARIMTLRPQDERERSGLQQMIVGLVAITFFMALTFAGRLYEN